MHEALPDPSESPALWRRVLASGSLASLASAIVLAWHGRRYAGSVYAPLNAPAHWLWGRRSLRRDDPSLRHTATGMLVHHASSLWWAFFFEKLLARGAAARSSVLIPAASVTALAALVDLKATPERLTPGFERRLPRHSLVWVYVGFAGGLALAALSRRR
jgi:hypothetical protein